MRQYRYLLRTAPADALEAAHAEALALLAPDHEHALLETLQRVSLVGGHLHADDHTKLAHLLVSVERRSPGQLLPALAPEVLHALAPRVLDAESSFGLLNGYQSWDGEEPRAEPEGAWAEAGFNPYSGRWSLNRRMHGDSSGMINPGGGGPGADGGG